jgi:hypothetical protein
VPLRVTNWEWNAYIVKNGANYELRSKKDPVAVISEAKSEPEWNAKLDDGRQVPNNWTWVDG